jgi:hypothetical protein
MQKTHKNGKKMKIVSKKLKHETNIVEITHLVFFIYNL